MTVIYDSNIMTVKQIYDRAAMMIHVQKIKTKKYTTTENEI